MDSEAPLILIERRDAALRIVPAQPLGTWAVRPVGRALDAVHPSERVELDLRRAPVSEPAHVAAVMWLDREAAERSVPLEISVPDMVSAELLAFGGVAAPLHVAEAPRADVERALTRALA